MSRTIRFLGRMGRVVYTFGSGQPTLVATPASRKFIELQPGEKNPGRASDWRLRAMGCDTDLVGVRDAATPILVVKPKVTGLGYNHDCRHGTGEPISSARFKAR